MGLAGGREETKIKIMIMIMIMIMIRTKTGTGIRTMTKIMTRNGVPESSKVI
jgi:hypothetical protein